MLTFGRLVAVLMSLAFGLQSYIAQTHIHQANAAGRVAVAQTSGKGAPTGDWLVDCPFCQAVSGAGSFLAPAAPVLFFGAQWIEIAAPQFAFSEKHATANHSWRSRAPPSPDR